MQERDELLEKGERARAAEKSAIVRRELKKVEEAGKKLETTYKDKHSKLKTKQKIPGVTIKPEKIAKDENRKKIVELTWQHLKELENKERNPGRASKLLAESGPPFSLSFFLSFFFYLFIYLFLFFSFFLSFFPTLLLSFGITNIPFSNLLFFSFRFFSYCFLYFFPSYFNLVHWISYVWYNFSFL